MYVQSLYNELLLPGIEEFCQGFFPSLIEQVLDKQPSQHKPNELDAQHIAQSFLNKLYECLSVIDKDNNDTQQKTTVCSKKHRSLPIEIEQYSEPAARKLLGHGRNPFSPSHLQILIHETLVEARATNPDVIEEAILDEFQMLAEGFYRQLNNLYHAYATTSVTMSGRNNDTGEENYQQAHAENSVSKQPFSKHAPFDHTSQWSKGALVSEAPASNKPLALSLADAEESIQNTKYFFDNELTLETVGPSLYPLTRKLYIPILNRSLDVEQPFLNGINTGIKSAIEVDANHPIEQLVYLIKKIGRTAKHQDDSPLANKLIKTTERVIGNFIQTSLNGEDTLGQAIAELEELTHTLLDSAPPINQASGAEAEPPLITTDNAISASKADKTPEFHEGQWFDYILEGGQVIRCRIAAIIRQTQQYIFVSRQGRKVLSLHQNDLPAYIEGGLLRQHINSAITGTPIDSTLENVFSTIKKAHQAEKDEA